jgi:nicotinamidase-related amidase
MEWRVSSIMTYATLATIATMAAILPTTAPAQQPGSRYLEPLSPDNSLLLLVDLQPQYAFTVASIDTQTLINNAIGITKAAKVFAVPTVLATISAQSFAGPFFPQVQAVLPGVTPRDRTAINAWEDQSLVDEIRRSGRKKIIVGGLWTDSCVTLPVLSALRDGYEVYVLADVAGDVNQMSHEMAMLRMVQAGATPVTWLAVLLEWQRDWAREETAGAVSEIAKAHGGAFGMGITYARAMGIGRTSK